MRIQALTLKNFRSHENTQLKLDRLNIIRGPNGAGKSSIQLAIDYLLTGSNQFTDSAGRGAEGLIRHGAGEFQIEAEISLLAGLGDARIKVARNKAGGSIMFEADEDAPKVNAAARLAISSAFGQPEVLGAVLNSGRFVEMSPKEQKEFLAAAVGGDEVFIEPAIRELLNDEKLTKVRSAAEVDLLHDKYFDERTQVGRDIKALGEIPKPAEDKDMPTAAATQEKIEWLQTEYRAVTGRIAKRQGDYAAKLQAERHRVATRRQQVAAAREQKRKAEEFMLDADELATNQRAIDTATRREAIQDELATATRRVENAKGKLAAIEGIGGECPTCTRTLSPQAKKNMVKALKDELENNEIELNGAKEAWAMYKIDPAVAKSKLEAHARGEAQAKTAVDYLAVLEGDDLGLDPQDTGAPAEPPEHPETQLAADTMARIKKGQEVLQRIAAIEGAQTAYKLQTQHKATLEARHTTLERLVQYFGADLKAKMLGGKLEKFVEALNAHLSGLGFVCKFQLEPTYKLEVTYKMLYDAAAPAAAAHIWRTLSQLSESEAYRFGIAFQVALAMATGVRFVIIDRADMLTPDNRADLAGMLLDTELDQAIVLATDSTMTWPSHIPPDVKFIDLLNPAGKTEIRAEHERAKELTYEVGE